MLGSTPNSTHYEIDEEKEAYYKDDPKKALKKFFDREGLEFEYVVEEEGPPRARVFTASVRLGQVGRALEYKWLGSVIKKKICL